MLDNKILGERFKLVREKLGVKPRPFAMMAHVDPSQYNKLENGGEKGLGPDKIVDLCSAWEINQDWLFTGKGEMFKPGNGDKIEIEPLIKSYQDRIEELKFSRSEEKRILENHNKVLEDVIKANLTVIIENISGVKDGVRTGLGIVSSISTRTEDLNQEILKILNERLPPPAPARLSGNNGE